MSNNKYKILVVEDDRNISSMIQTVLYTNGYQVLTAQRCQQGILMLTSHVPDLILLDLGLPDMDGVDIIKQTREWSSIPIIVISARIQEKEKVAALDAGADDYITKPFGTEELLARIRTAFRHSNRISAVTGNSNRPYFAKGLVIDFDKRIVSVDGNEVHLTRVEYKIVSMLAKYSGKVITYTSLINQVWGPYADDNNRILRVNMANIRRKLEKNPGEPEYIFTELGIGYRMVEDENTEM